MDTLKIIMTSTFYPPYHFGGDAVHVKLLKEELEARGHEVHVVHSLDAYRLKGGRSKVSEQDNVHPVVSSFGPTSARMTYLTGRNRKAERLLREVIDKVRPDIIHHHNVSLLGEGVLEAGDVPKLYTAHDYWPMCPRSDLMRNGRATCEQLGCLPCCVRSMRPPQLWRDDSTARRFLSLDAVIAPSAFMSSKLKGFLGLPSQVLPNFTRSKEAPDVPYTGHFVYVGVLERGKGVDLLLDAFSSPRAKDLEIHVFGRGSLEGRVRQAERATSGRIKYFGFQTGKPLWENIVSAAAMIMPSRVNDNCPISCVEALSLGVPLIVSDRGGLPELTKDPDCGRVVRPTASAIAEAASSMADSSALREALSRNAKKRYERWHTADAYLARYLEIIEAVRRTSDHSPVSP